MSQKQLSTEHLENDQVCIPNISPSERRKRLSGGVLMAVVAIAVLVALLVAGVSRWWRLALIPLFWGGATGFFQWQDET